MRIGVFCSGGDAPGMNACVRAVVRTAVAAGHEVVGIQAGYQGLLEESFYVDVDGQPRMSLRSVSGWTRFGGTFLQTSRCEEFKTPAGRQKAAEILRRHRIDALIPIGGDGTFRGASEFAAVWDGQIVGCPGTIDNDLLGTDETIGFSTAVETAVDAIDKIRDTAESHSRMFLIEVMGRHSGYIAVHSAIASGSEVVCIPETCTSVDSLCQQLRELRSRGKTSVMLIIAEGDEWGGAEKLNSQLIQAGCPFPTRVAILGHLQRGGSPTPEDRILASQLGCWAVRGIMEGRSKVMAGRVAGACVYTPLEATYASHKPIAPGLLELVSTMAH
jgi:6-phosphofructokinase 1